MSSIRQPSRALAILSGTVAVIFWGASFVSTKIALVELQPLTLVFMRFFIGTLFLAPLVAKIEGLQLPSPGDLVGLILFGFLGVALSQGLQAMGMLTTSATAASWITALSPALIALMGWIFLREKARPLQILGLVLALGGALWVSTGRTSFQLQGKELWGPFLVLLGATGWALFSILGKHMVQFLPPLRMTYYGMMIGWFLLLPVFLWQRGWEELGTLSTSTWGAVAFLGIACTALAYGLYFIALKGAETALVAALQYFEPLTTVVLAWLILAERVQIEGIFGGVLILLGVGMVERARIGFLTLERATDGQPGESDQGGFWGRD